MATMMITHKHIPNNILCANKAVITTLQKENPLPPLTLEWDLLEASRKLVQDHRRTFIHVAGHQDDKKEGDEYTNTELNSDMIDKFRYSFEANEVNRLILILVYFLSFISVSRCEEAHKRMK